MVFTAPVRQVAHLFWIGLCRQEEERHIHAEGHAFTSWWIHNSIEFAEGHRHHDWDEWAEMRGLNYGRRKRRQELVNEINEKWDKVFHAGLRFTAVPVT